MSACRGVRRRRPNSSECPPFECAWSWFHFEISTLARRLWRWQYANQRGRKKLLRFTIHGQSYHLLAGGLSAKRCRVTSSWRWCYFLLGCLGPLTAFAQIDPIQRNLFQFGYNVAMQGHAPLAAYAYYYRNQPNFLSESNLTLRLAIAPKRSIVSIRRSDRCISTSTAHLAG